MQAIVFKALREATVEGIAEPAVGPSGVLVEVAATGVCHTDIDIPHGRAYHDGMSKQGVKLFRPLADDLAITDPVLQ